MAQDHQPVINLNDIELDPRPDDFTAPGDAQDRFDANMGAVASKIGAKLLGYNLTSIPPGKSAFPMHNHHVNEEMFLILVGEGILRVGEKQYPIKSNDIIACPPGGPETAHQITNNGTEPLRFLAVSTRLSPEYVEYPESGKFGVYAQRSDERGTFRFISREGNSLDYWEDE